MGISYRLYRVEGSKMMEGILCKSWVPHWSIVLDCKLGIFLRQGQNRSLLDTECKNLPIQWNMSLSCRVCTTNGSGQTAQQDRLCMSLRQPLTMFHLGMSHMYCLASTIRPYIHIPEDLWFIQYQGQVCVPQGWNELELGISTGYLHFLWTRLHFPPKLHSPHRVQYKVLQNDVKSKVRTGRPWVTSGRQSRILHIPSRLRIYVMTLT